MKNISSLILTSFIACIVQAQDCKDIFISEYVEGTWNNKAIELYNPTNQTVDLSRYSLSRYSNGGSTPSITQLGGLIEPFSTFVIVIDKRDPNGSGQNVPVWNGYWNDDDDANTDAVYDASEDLQSAADTFMNPNYAEANTMYFNGNDALVLENVSGIIDMFGKVGEDPGDAWSDENEIWWTRDQTLVRKQTVINGFVYNPSDVYVFDPTLEWDSLPANTFSELGQHVCDCSDNLSVSELKNFVRTYPNPNSSGFLTIEGSSAIKEINIFNLIGQNVFSRVIEENVLKETISIDASLNGIYFMAVRMENNERILKKVILK